MPVESGQRMGALQWTRILVISFSNRLSNLYIFNIMFCVYTVFIFAESRLDSQLCTPDPPCSDIGPLIIQIKVYGQHYNLAHRARKV